MIYSACPGSEKIQMSRERHQSLAKKSILPRLLKMTIPDNVYLFRLRRHLLQHHLRVTMHFRSIILSLALCAAVLDAAPVTPAEIVNPPTLVSITGLIIGKESCIRSAVNYFGKRLRLPEGAAKWLLPPTQVNGRACDSACKFQPNNL